MLGMRVGSPHPVPWRDSQMTSSLAIERYLLITNVCQPGTPTHPTPPFNLHLPMEVWLFCIFSEHLLSHIPSYPLWCSPPPFFVTLIDFDIASSPLHTPLQNPPAPKNIRKQHTIGYFIMERKGKIYISLCKANTLRFPHQTSISLFQSSHWSI